MVAFNDNVERLKEDASHVEQHKAMMMGEINSKNRIIEDLSEKYRLQSHTMLGLVSQIETIKGELFSIKQLKEAGDATILELNRTLTEAKSDIHLVIAERNSLRSLVTQQDAALRVQSDQSDTSLNILQQRQAIIEKLESHSKNVEDELNKLQGILQSVIARNGDELLAELFDVRHLVELISNAKKHLESGIKPEAKDASMNTQDPENKHVNKNKFHESGTEIFNVSNLEL